MIQPYKFIGFAGLGDFHPQANILAHILTKFTDQQVNIKSSLGQGLSQVIWQVTNISHNYADHLPNYFINGNDQIIAQLSAGGFAQPDIWVKIQEHPDGRSNIIDLL